MARSKVSVHPVENLKGEITVVDIEATGGTRRERGAAIAAAARTYGKPLTLVRTSYSETYGFNTATYARYTVTA